MNLYLETNFVTKHDSADSSLVGWAQNYPNERPILLFFVIVELGGKQFKQRCDMSVSAMSRNVLCKAFFQKISDLRVPKAAYTLTK